ncbi:conserved hypothetical protein [Bacillus cereus ATCC 10987]|uniref:Uncharacterized protein n=1 Tax=Bacillus cereus (strain ATCC 10987 / NRS 248) TaxID=222523 RepID=Q739H4_BACC1|nr:conserved hypothetical protein [Bacillus cereus ATCC 10987]
MKVCLALHLLKNMRFIFCIFTDLSSKIILTIHTKVEKYNFHTDFSP